MRRFGKISTRNKTTTGNKSNTLTSSNGKTKSRTEKLVTSKEKKGELSTKLEIKNERDKIKWKNTLKKLSLLTSSSITWRAWKMMETDRKKKIRNKSRLIPLRLLLSLTLMLSGKKRKDLKFCSLKRAKKKNSLIKNTRRRIKGNYNQRKKKNSKFPSMLKLCLKN